MEEKKSQYPYQIGAIKRTKKTLGVDAKLYLPTEKEDKNPLEIHSGFSRFELTILDKENDVKPIANIPAGEIPYIKEKTKLAMSKMMNGLPMDANPTATEKTDPAYTVTLTDKTYKGMTPAAVLIRNPADKERLIAIKEWLKPNIAKYPRNKQQIEAIDSAIALLDAGKLENNTSIPKAAATDLIEIYKTDYKYKSKTNEKGYNLVYGINIMCNPGKQYPFCVNITNAYAPVETESTGQKNIKMQQAEDIAKSFILISECEWFSLVDRMETTLKNFENMNFPKQFEKSNRDGWHPES